MTITIPPLAIGALMEQCDFDKIGLPPRDSRTPPQMQPPAGAIVLPTKCHDCCAPLNWSHIHLIYGTAYCHACAASGRED